MVQDEPVVSIIIPTYNNSNTISRCISSIHDQTYENVDVIVVDSESADGTQDIVKDFDVTLHIEETTRAEARNLGAELANGDYYFHLDSDMELSESVVEECVDLCEHRFDAIVVPERNIGDTYWAKCTDFGKQIKNKSKVGYLRFIDAGIYESIGGHDEELVAGEDLDMHLRAINDGAKVGYANSYILHNVGDISLSDYVNDRRKYSETTGEFLDKYNGAPSRKTIDKKVMIKEIIRNPILSLGFIFMNIISFLIYKIYS